MPSSPGSCACTNRPEAGGKQPALRGGLPRKACTRPAYNGSRCVIGSQRSVRGIRQRQSASKGPRDKGSYDSHERRLLALRELRRSRGHACRRYAVCPQARKDTTDQPILPDVHSGCLRWREANGRQSAPRRLYRGPLLRSGAMPVRRSCPRLRARLWPRQPPPPGGMGTRLLRSRLKAHSSSAQDEPCMPSHLSRHCLRKASAKCHQMVALSLSRLSTEPMPKLPFQTRLDL